MSFRFTEKIYQLSTKPAWRHCNFGNLQTLIETYFKTKYFVSFQICFKLPTNAWARGIV